MHHFLDEQEKLLLAQLKEMEREIVKHQKIYDTKVSDEIVALTILIDEIEEKLEQPDSEFLQVRECLQKGTLKRRCANYIVMKPYIAALGDGEDPLHWRCLNRQDSHLSRDAVIADACTGMGFD